MAHDERGSASPLDMAVIEANALALGLSVAALMENAGRALAEEAALHAPGGGRVLGQPQDPGVAGQGSRRIPQHLKRARLDVQGPDQQHRVIQLPGGIYRPGRRRHRVPVTALRAGADGLIDQQPGRPRPQPLTHRHTSCHGEPRSPGRRNCPHPHGEAELG